MGAIRITLFHEGTAFNVLDRELVDMTALGGDPLDLDFGRLVGTWVELRGGKEEVVFRRVVDDPLREGVEVFAPPQDERPPVGRIPVEVPSGYVVFVVPALPGVQRFVLVRAVPSGDGKTRDVSELVSVDVDDLAPQQPFFGQDDPTKGGV